MSTFPHIILFTLLLFFGIKTVEGDGPLVFQLTLSTEYYTTKLSIGTPPQIFNLGLDLRHSLTYVRCSSCVDCGEHKDSRFQPDLSSSYSPVKCNSNCSCDNTRSQCTYKEDYEGTQFSKGVLLKDVVSLGNDKDYVTIGCAEEDTRDLYEENIDGIIGMGRDGFIYQIADKVGSSFSLCYGGMNSVDGVLLLGEVSRPANMVFSSSNPVHSPDYTLELKGMTIAGRDLNSQLFIGSNKIVLDSRNKFSYLPHEAFQAFQDGILKNIKHLNQTNGPDPGVLDLCFSGAGSDATKLSDQFPSIDLIFDHGQKLSLAPENYLYRHSKLPGAYCLGVFENEDDSTTVFGDIIFRNTLIMFDLPNEKIGFLKTNCSVFHTKNSTALKRSWWKRHRSVVFGVSVVVAASVVGFGMYMIWHLWKQQRQESHSNPGQLAPNETITLYQL